MHTRSKLIVLVFFALVGFTPVNGETILPDSLIHKLEGKVGKERLEVWDEWHFAVKRGEYDIPTYLGSLDYFCKDLQAIYAQDSALYWCFKRKLYFAEHATVFETDGKVFYKDLLLEAKFLADSIAEKFENPHRVQIEWLLAYSRFYFVSGNLPKANEQLELGLKINETINDDKLLFRLYRKHSYYSFFIHEKGTPGYLKAVDYLKRSKELIGKIDGTPEDKFFLNYDLGLYHYDEKRYNEALIFFRYLFDNVQVVDEKDQIKYQLMYLGLHADVGRSGEVIEQIEKIYKDPKTKEDLLVWSQLLQTYSSLLASSGETEKFFAVEKEYYRTEWQLTKNSNTESTIGLQRSLGLFEKNAELKTLEQENLNKQAKSRTILILAISAGLLALIGLFVYFQYYNSKRKRLFIFQERKKQISENRNRLFSSITHDIRTPLALMMGPVERAKGKTQSPNIINDLNLVTSNGQKLMDLFTQILDWNKVESNALHLNPQVGELEITIPLIIQRLQQQAIEKGISFTYALELSPGQYKIDFDKLEKIIVNISKNAFKFCTPGSEFSIKVKTKRDSLELELKDNGPGILAAELPYVFDRYFKGSGGKEKGGTGIGLAIVKEIVDLMSGTISLESKEKEGTCFYIQLPIQFVAETEESFSNSNETISTEKSRILVVEDEPELLKFIASSLQDNFEVTTADSATVGWSLVQSQLPDIVLSDWNMPDETGGWLCAKIKSNSLTGHIPVLILTANDSDLNRKEAFDAGAVAWMGKPFRVEMLQLQLQTILNQQSKAQELGIKVIEAEMVETPEEDQESLDPFIQHVIDIIKTNFALETFSVEQLADEIGIHRVQLSRKVKAISGKSPSELIKEFRLNKAKILLNKTAQNISEIAYAIGFSNPNYFATAYKKYFGISPTAERDST